MAYDRRAALIAVCLEIALAGSDVWPGAMPVVVPPLVKDLIDVNFDHFRLRPHVSPSDSKL